MKMKGIKVFKKKKKKNLVFLDYFDVLKLKINLKIILIYFSKKIL
jgi:hypothetical protein